MKHAVCRQIGGEADTFYSIFDKAKVCIKVVLRTVEQAATAIHDAAAR